MKSVALHNLGCKVNAYEIEVMQQKMEEKGFRIVPFAPGADIYIINTCTVTNIADRKSRQMLHKAKKMNPDAIVVATGCYVQTDEKTIEMDPCIDLAIGNNKKKDIASIIEEYMSALKQQSQKVSDSQYDIKTLHHTSVLDINQTIEYEEMTLKKTIEHTRAYIKIQDGCNQFCSYCIIPYARGRVRSRKPEDIMNEIKGLVNVGYQEIVITGIHISSYGMDFITDNTNDYLELRKDLRAIAYQKEYLLSLMKEIESIDGLKRIRIGSLEPRIITDKFAGELSKLSKICPHFHLSLQSGSDTVLKRMNRHYNTSEYYEKVMILRQYFNNPAITTDIITGFPGETDDEFKQTVEFVKKVCFYEMHIFKYSKRKGTVAAAMENQIEETIKSKRSDVLLQLEKEQSIKFRQKLFGQDVEVLMEEKKMIGDESFWIGHTMNYILVAKRTQEDLSNKMIHGTIAGVLSGDILFIE